jgi:uncharacterized protein (TIGR02646 family)
MIRLPARGKAPSSLSSSKVKATKKDIASRIKRGQSLAKSFPTHWLAKDVRDPLWKLHNGKCAYCERTREIKRESDVEHYRPKSAIMGYGGAGYWWLAYNWRNYLYACKPCNQGAKKTQFPLLPGGIRAKSPRDSLTAERPALLNPFDDDPEKCLTYDWQHGNGALVKVLGLDDEGRGNRSIEILDLNRLVLMEERAEILDDLRMIAESMRFASKCGAVAEVKQIAKIIAKKTSRKATFSGFRRNFFRSYGLNQYLAVEP